MRVAWVTYDFEEYSVLQVNALAQEHDVLLVMPPCASPEYAVSDAVEHFAFEKPRLRQPIRQWRSVRTILNRIHEFKPDVVHFQQGHMWFNLGLSALKRYPLVITVHDPRHHAGDVVSRKTPQWLMDYGFRKADHVVVHGRPLAKQVQDLFGCSKEQVHVIPHVAMGELEGKLNVVEDPNLVLFFGRIWDYKGLDQLIAAEPIVTREYPDARFMIAGEGEDFAKYRELMQNPEHFLVHNERVSDFDRARYFQKAALVVLPYNEATQSGVVPVAYNYSKPVVATRVGALAECVEHGVTGLLVPARDPEALAEAILALLKNSALRYEMGAAAKRRLVAESSPSVVAKLTAEVYERACGISNRMNPHTHPTQRHVTECVSSEGGR
ncbi:MAG: glycosyltransferase family 4 protein [Pirellulaceae bacterium]